jgi:polyvinyl alcohol dehydrogenase (cytochrome)
VYALDFDTGCVRWRFVADAEVRTAIVIEPWTAGDTTAHPRLFFGDLSGQAYAVDARTGKMLWKRRVDTHPALTITGSPRYYNGRLYVPMSSTEFASAADPEYPCCSFRGGVSALDATDGTPLWTSYSITQSPQPATERTPSGKQRFHPAGAPVWTSPTIDVRRGRLYVGTGESYTSPAASTSDAVLALDLKTGAILWHYQSLARDAWTLACVLKGPNCPRDRGSDLSLDLDVSTPPVLIDSATAGANASARQDILIAGQKSGHVFALNPDSGELLWRRKVGRGGYAGGIHWGMATDGQTLFAPNADTDFFPTDVQRGTATPGLFALDVLSGETKWFAPARDVCSPSTRPACDPGISAAATAIPGAVFTGGFDGRLLAYAASSGQVLWEFDTNREFASLSGVPAHGGSIGSGGPVVAYGALLVNSGYLMGGVRMPGNVLLKFKVPRAPEPARETP